MKTKFTKKYDDYQNYIITYMKIDFKKISMFSILILLVFCGCRGEFNQNFEIENTKNTNFFNSKVDAEIVEIVKKINDKTNFVSKISDKFGLPDWENANKSTGSYTSKDINETIIIPLKDENNIHLTSLLFIENASSDNPNVYTVTNHQLYQYLIDKRNKLSDKENLMMTFLHFDNQIFGRENYYNMPKDLFTKFLKSSKHKLGTMHLFGKRTSSPTAKDSTFCLIVENCNGLCNGPCDGCGVCTTSLCYNLGGGYDSGGGDFGEGGPYNGGTTPVGSGGGTTVINAPWYLNSGIDMSLYTNHVRKIYFSLGNFGMYLNQSQVDFLQERLDITSMFNNYFASAASLNEAKFAFWGIKFFIQNPNTTVQQFRNWFMGRLEGKDGEENLYDPIYWENPNLTFPQQSLPSWQNFYNAFPHNPDGSGMTAAQVYQIVGGEIYQRHISTNPNISKYYQNACALRVSRALNYSGISIPAVPGTMKGGDGKNYFLAAKALNSWMRKSFGTNPATATTPYNPNHSHFTASQGGIYGQNFPSLLNGKKGIFSMVTEPWWASGHADALQSNGMCINNCHFGDAPIIFIDIWELN